jgi:hypothetical protein
MRFNRRPTMPRALLGKPIEPASRPAFIARVRVLPFTHNPARALQPGQCRVDGRVSDVDRPRDLKAIPRALGLAEHDRENPGDVSSNPGHELRQIFA